jgi:DNA-binding PadR family transcriptional regulator
MYGDRHMRGRYFARKAQWMASRFPGAFEMEAGFGPQRGRGGRRGKLFDGNELRLILLRLIADQPRHGYDLIKAIEELSDGAYAPSPGVVYPTLTMLGDMGLIEEAQSEGAKRSFAITVDGADHLEANAAKVQALFERLSAMGEARAKTDRHAVRRAMGNLREVLMHKLTGGQANDDMIDAIVAAIDETAQKIERMK